MDAPQPLIRLNANQFMETPHGLKTVQDIYEALDHCAALHKHGTDLNRALLIFLDRPVLETLAALRHEIMEHDIALAKACKIVA